MKSDGIALRTVKETKSNVRSTKVTNNIKPNEKPTVKRTVTVSRNLKDDKSKLLQPTLIHAVISDANHSQNIENVGDPQIVNIQTPTIENVRTVVRTADLKNIIKPSIKTARPSIIKKAIIKEPVPISSVATTIVVSNV